jgi:hypothetical protein
MKEDNSKHSEQSMTIKVPKGVFCGDCPYYLERGPTCVKIGGQVPFHLSKYCINFDGKKYSDCPNYR